MLHLLTAVTVLAVIQLVEGAVGELLQVEHGDTLLYGYRSVQYIIYNNIIYSKIAIFPLVATLENRSLGWSV